MLLTGDFLDLLFKDAIEQTDRKIAESATVIRLEFSTLCSDRLAPPNRQGPSNKIWRLQLFPSLTEGATEPYDILGGCALGDW